MPTPHKHAALIRQWVDDPVQPVWYWNRSMRNWDRAHTPGWDESSYYALGAKPAQPPLPPAFTRRFWWTPSTTGRPAVSIVTQDEQAQEPRERWAGFIRWIDADWQKHELPF